MSNYRDSTHAVRVGQYIDLSDSHCEPIAYTSAYTFRSAADAAAKFQGSKPGNVYSRFTNPSVQAFEERLSALEAAEDAVAFSSGMAAIAAIGLAFLKAGDSVVCSRDVFGTTLTAFLNYFARLGVNVRVVELVNLAGWRAAIDETTRFVFLETPSNPVLDVADIREIADVAHFAGALVVVDNTMLTPFFQKPLELGADLVVHSAGKYIDGHGRCIAGAVAGKKELTKDLRAVLRVLGFTMSPMNAWLLSKSMETLNLRMQHVSTTSTHLAYWLRQQSCIRKVNFTVFPDHPQQAIIARQQKGHGGVLSFRINGDLAEAWRFIDSLRLISIATNIGDSRTMVTHPASTTHHRMEPEERERAGIADDLLRLSIGLEDEEDLRSDIAQALVRAGIAQEARENVTA